MNSAVKIILAGGGTLGSVSPLIAIWQELSKQNIKIDTLFVGTTSGPEKNFLKQYPAIKFASLPSAKWRRYLSLLNLFTPFLFVLALSKALVILSNFRPKLIISAGGFTSVPLIWLGKLMGSKVIIHQLDLEPTLSNKLTKQQADLITVTFEKSLNDFPKKKTVLVGPLIRQEANVVIPTEPAESAGERRNPLKVINEYKENTSHKAIPTTKNLLFLGGGTGALSLNKLIVEALPLLDKQLNVIHVTGRGKNIIKGNQPNYSQVEFLTAEYYQKINEADLVVSRAGLSTLLELSFFAKPVILVPLPNSHQEVNAGYYQSKKAAINVKQNHLTAKILAAKINSLAQDKAGLKELSKNIKMMAPNNGAFAMIKEIVKLLG